MNAFSESRILRIPVRQRYTSRRPLDGLVRSCRAGYEIVLEAWETLADAFAMPLRPPHDRSLERLDDGLLNDIGYAGRAGSKPDLHF
jgi:hypothetical protein